jgi:hypothetical protein
MQACWSRAGVDVRCRQAGAVRLGSQASRVKFAVSWT